MREGVSETCPRGAEGHAGRDGRDAEQPWQARRLLTQRGAAGATACASPSRDLAKVPVGFVERMPRGKR